MRTIAMVLLLLDLANARSLAGPQADYDSLMKAVEIATDVARTSTNAAQVREDAIAFGLATLDRAAKLNGDASGRIWQLTYRATLLEAKAELTSDSKLKDEAWELHRQVIEIQKARRKEKLLADARKHWAVWVVQDGQIVFGIDDERRLDRRPFTVVVGTPKIEPVMFAVGAGKMHALKFDRTTKGELNLLEHDITPAAGAKEMSLRVAVGADERELTIRFR